MLAEIEELSMIIAPKLFGKPYSQLDFMVALKNVADSEVYKCSQEAQKIRLEALKRAGKAGREYSSMKWPEFLGYCEEVLTEMGYGREPGEDL